MNFARDIPLQLAFDRGLTAFDEKTERIVSDWRPRSESAPGPLEEALAEVHEQLYDINYESLDLLMFLDNIYQTLALCERA